MSDDPITVVPHQAVLFVDCPACRVANEIELEAYEMRGDGDVSLPCDCCGAGLTLRADVHVALEAAHEVVDRRDKPPVSGGDA